LVYENIPYIIHIAIFHLPSIADETICITSFLNQHKQTKYAYCNSHYIILKYFRTRYTIHIFSCLSLLSYSFQALRNTHYLIFKCTHRDTVQNIVAIYSLHNVLNAFFRNMDYVIFKMHNLPLQILRNTHYVILFMQFTQNNNATMIIQ